MAHLARRQFPDWYKGSGGHWNIIQRLLFQMWRQAGRQPEPRRDVTDFEVLEYDSLCRPWFDTRIVFGPETLDLCIKETRLRFPRQAAGDIARLQVPDAEHWDAWAPFSLAGQREYVLDKLQAACVNRGITCEPVDVQTD